MNKKNDPHAKAIFLDRDGVLNKDSHYINHPNKIEWLPNVSTALKALKNAGFLLIVITNQSGIARNYMTEETVQTIHHSMNTTLKSTHIQIDHFYYCPHHPGTNIPEKIKQNNPYIQDCSCRKPKTGMIQQAQKAYNINLKKSFLIGDKETDIQAGNTAEIKSIAVLCGQGTSFEHSKPWKICQGLEDATHAILASQ